MAKNVSLDDELTKIAEITGVYKPPPQDISAPYCEGYERGKQEMARLIIAFGVVALIVIAIAVWWITADMRMATIVNNAPSPAEMHEYLGGKQ